VVREVALTNVVVRGPPFTSTTEVGVNPVPVRVKVLAVVAPAATAVGASVVITGKGLTTGNGKILDVPPLGGAGGGASGFVTANCNVPAVEMSSTFRETSIAVLFMKVDVRFVLLTVTIDWETKLVPESMMEPFPVPARIVEGDAEVICGTSLGAGVIVNVSAVDVPPPGVEVKTVTVALPGL